MDSVIFTYKLPKSVADRCKVETVGIRELTGQDEVDAGRRSRGDQAALAFELAKASLCRAGERAISLADATTDRFWNELGPQGRRLVITAYTRVNNPQDQEVTDFLSSATTTVG